MIPFFVQSHTLGYFAFFVKYRQTLFVCIPSFLIGFVAIVRCAFIRRKTCNLFFAVQNKHWRLIFKLIIIVSAIKISAVHAKGNCNCAALHYILLYCTAIFNFRLCFRHWYLRKQNRQHH